MIGQLCIFCLWRSQAVVMAASHGLEIAPAYAPV